MKNFKLHSCFPLFLFSFAAVLIFSPFAEALSPIVKVKIAEYPNLVRFKCPSGGKWVSGEKTGNIKPSDTCTINGNITSPAIIKFHIMVESIPMREPDKVKASLEKWKSTGRPIHTFELGKISYADDGKTVSYDGRVIYIGVGIFMDQPSAQKLVDELAALGNSSWIMEEIIQLAKGRLTLEINGARISESGNNFKIFPIQKMVLEKVEHAKGYAWHGFADRTFSGEVDIHWGARNAIDCVLSTDLEAILAGVVPSEISSKAAIGALQAQAVAARGEMLSKLGMRHLNEGFSFCSEQHCQVFSGDSAIFQAMANSISPTRGLVLHDSLGGIVDAVYAANCGGHSEASHLVWTSPPCDVLAGGWDSLKPHNLKLENELQVRQYILNPPQVFCNDPTVEGGDKFRWKKTISGSDWKDVETRGEVGRIREFKDIARGVSGRLYRITLVGEKGNRSIMKELAIRKLFGGLRSACFIADWKRGKDGFISGAAFSGAGWGHGVGMCQTGAQSMARKGYAFQKILAHYFPGSKLVKIY